MTKTTLLLLLGGLCALPALGPADPSPAQSPLAPIAWEQPPGVPPCPGGGIIIKAGDETSGRALSWEQPPGVPPRPGGDIIIKAQGPSSDRVV